MKTEFDVKFNTKPMCKLCGKAINFGDAVACLQNDDGTPDLLSTMHESCLKKELEPVNAKEIN